jgi:hypothetical protein
MPADQSAARAGKLSLVPASGTAAVKKAVDTLAIVPTRDKISLLTRKVYNVMLHYAQTQGAEHTTYRARLRDVINLVDFNSNNTEVIKGYFRSMVTTRVEWQSPTKAEGTNWGVSGMIAHAELVTLKGGDVMLEWSYSPKLQQAILDPQRYARISLGFVSQLRTHAALVLYEICSRYVAVGLTVRNPWPWWRPVLTGAPEGTHETYNEWKYFKRDCIAKAVAEVNAVTDLEIEAVEHRQGRVVSDLQFKVRNKAQPKLPLRGVATPVDLRDIGLAIQLGVPQEVAEKLQERHGATSFKGAVQALAARIARKDLEVVRSPEKFLAVLLAGADGVQAPAALKKPEDSKAKRVALLETFREQRRKEAEALFTERPQQQQQEILRRFQDELAASPAAAKTFEKRGLGAPITRALFLKFLAEDAFGKSWDQPTDTELLEHAIQ